MRSALRMTKLEFKLGTAQYLSRIFHYEQMNMCSSVRQGNISALIGKEEEQGGKRLFFFSVKISSLGPSLSRSQCSQIPGRKGKPSTITLGICMKWRNQNTLLVQTWRNQTVPSVQRPLLWQCSCMIPKRCNALEQELPVLQMCPIPSWGPYGRALAKVLPSAMWGCLQYMSVISSLQLD